MNNGNFKTVLKYINKEEKVELSSEVVELASIKDLDKMRIGLEKEVDGLTAESKQLTEIMRKYSAAQKEYKKSVSLTKKGIKQMETDIKKFQKEAESLGLGDVPMVQTILSAADKLMNQMKPHIQRADKIK